MKKIFISHPLTGDIEGNRKKEKEITEAIMENQLGIPISPLQLFNYIAKENEKIRKVIMQVCERLIDLSDEVWIYGESEGCNHERRYAEQQGKIVKIKYGENKGE